MSSYQYRKSHCGDKTVVRSSYLHNGIFYTGKITSLYWNKTLVYDSFSKKEVTGCFATQQTSSGIRSGTTYNSLRPSDAYICVGNLTIIGSDNGLSPGLRQAIIWTNAGILLMRPLGTNFNEILIEIHKIQGNPFETVVWIMASIVSFIINRC